MVIDPLKNIGNLDTRSVKRVFEFLRQTQDEIIAALEGAKSFTRQDLLRVLAEVNAVIAEFKKRYAEILLKEFGAAYVAALKTVDREFKKAGIKKAAAVASLNRVEVMDQALRVLPQVSRIYGAFMPKVERVVGQAALGRFTITESIDEIKGIFKTNAAYRSERLVRTEIATVLNAGTRQRVQDYAKENKIKKYWLHTDDGRTRDSHRRIGRQTNPYRGGKPLDMNEKYSVGGFTAMYPGDPSLPVGERVNERCREAYFIER